ncbi:MAG: SusC/RagA family TonB-linked outer membrane protein, partial [Aliifodinibius sp.]|nr:SusC/RagA family TonB-linked outer membrane protein [Fodinibius sp.]NIV14965.1 SusC/RagA family TonB-linked outer membrane protein [Fodinibius sp.]NIY28812.1 SusC/RagA family TonB-linked outer membrane protein [Fodinibius sp.]
MYNRYKSLLSLAIMLLYSNIALAQFTVTGSVVDERTGELLVGANIFHAETSTGTTTDVNGEFTIELPGTEAILRISYVGYIAKNINVDINTEELVVELSSDVANLEEVVVTGLASSIKRENLANAVTSISSDELRGTSQSQTLSSDLYGKIPGANISANSGAPGGGISMKLRGVTTI